MAIIPRNELELIFRFAQEMPEDWEVLSLQVAFPDATLKIHGDVYKAEFEHKSESFVKHEHDLAQADLIICWIHDWPDCPLPVLEVKNPDWPGTLLFKLPYHEKMFISAGLLRQANSPKKLLKAQDRVGVAKKKLASARRAVERVEENLNEVERREATVTEQLFWILRSSVGWDGRRGPTTAARAERLVAERKWMDAYLCPFENLAPRLPLLALQVETIQEMTSVEATCGRCRYRKRPRCANANLVDREMCPVIRAILSGDGDGVTCLI